VTDKGNTTAGGESSVDTLAVLRNVGSRLHLYGLVVELMECQAGTPATAYPSAASELNVPLKAGASCPSVSFEKKII